MTKLKLILLLAPLGLDCFVNWLCGGSIMSTLSAEAWLHRNKGKWQWTHTFIDWLFYQGHCENAARVEAYFGSIWASWLHQYRTA